MARPWTTLLALALLPALSACPAKEDEAKASPTPGGEAPASSPALPAGEAPASEAAPAQGASAPEAPHAKALPAGLKPGLKAYEAVELLQQAGFVSALGITELGRGPKHGAYLEAWDPKAEPKGVFLHLGVKGGEFVLERAEANPPESLWRQLLPFGPKGLEEAKQSAEHQAANFTGEEAGVELLPRGQDGQTWEAPGGWHLVLAPGESAQLVGPKGAGGALPLQGRWGAPGVVQTLRVSASGENLALVERLPHSGLLACHVMVLDPQRKTYGPGSLEGP